MTEGGLRVVLLEAGRNLDAVRDFPGEARVGGIGLGGRLRSTIRGQQVQVRSPLFSETTKQFYVNDKLNPYTTPGGKPFLWLRGSAAVLIVGTTWRLWRQPEPSVRALGAVQ